MFDDLKPLETVRQKVREYYGERITHNRGCCSAEADTESIGLLDIPTYGCGTPTDFAALKLGETVLDLGSGAGLDAFRAAERVGDTGHVIGVDMTPAMLECAQTGAARLGITNADFRHGYIEALPVAAASVDAILSNCVINLSGDKSAVLREAYRVLKPGGRLAVSDIVRVGEAPAQTSDEGWCACSDGAETVSDYWARLQAAGFAAISFMGNPPTEGTYSAQLQAVKPAIRDALPADRQTIETVLQEADLPTEGVEDTELLVLEEDGAIVGVVGFEPYGDAALLRSLALRPAWRGLGLSRALLVAVFDRLRVKGVTTAYGLTTTIPDLLLELGFAEIGRGELPGAFTDSAQLQGPQACPDTARVFQLSLTPVSERR